MKVFIAGEASVHLSNYCRAISNYVDEIILLTETPLEVPCARRHYVLSFRETNPLRWLLHLNRLKKILKDEKPEIVHIHQVNRLAYFVSMALAKSTIPLISTAWGSDVLLVPQRNFLYRYFSKQVILKSKYITADARVMVEAMRGMVLDESKYVLLQYGIDPVSPGVKENIIFSNRLHRPLYNIDVILKDFSAFAKSNPGWKLYIGASGPDTEKLMKLAADLNISDRAIFLGWLNKEENARNYARAMMYVSIPSSDGTSVSLLEAMSADCIPIVSDLPVSKEWIEDHVNGIVRKDAVNPFQEALTLDRENCIRINRQRISSGVDRKETTRTFFELYQKALATK